MMKLQLVLMLLINQLSLLQDKKEIHKVTEIKVNIDQSNNEISVYNNGNSRSRYS